MRHHLLIIGLFVVQTLSAQYNIDRVLTAGRSALYYEDYVLSMQYFNQVISVKPYLYEPWYFRAIAKYNLDDYVGAESDCNEAIALRRRVPITTVPLSMTPPTKDCGLTEHFAVYKIRITRKPT